MKKTLIIALSILCLSAVNVVAADAIGSTFGKLTTAQAMGQGVGNLGGAVGIADATSFYGQFNYGLSEYMDGRIKAGMYDPGDGADAEMMLGVDFKYQMWGINDPAGKHPFDMAIGGFLEYLGGDFVSALEIGGQAIGSYPFTMSNGSTITPYGVINIRLESLSFDFPADFPGDDSETSIKFGLNAGAAWKIGSATTIYGELQLDGNDGVFFGVDFNVM